MKEKQWNGYQQKNQLFETKSRWMWKNLLKQIQNAKKIVFSSFSLVFELQGCLNSNVEKINIFTWLPFSFYKLFDFS
jgi:hypothetical protein